MRRSRPRPDLPDPFDLKRGTVRYLSKGGERKEARLLAACSLEVSEPLPMEDGGYFVNVTLRAERGIVDQLRPKEENGEVPLAMKRIKSAFMLALPADCALGKFEARAALTPNDPQQLLLLDEDESDGTTAKARGAPSHVFRKAGAVWRVVYNGSPEFFVDHTLGTVYLDILLHRPNQAVPAFELEVTARSDKGRVRRKDGVDQQSDDKARQAFLEEICSLRREREEAENNYDLGRVERIDEEIEAIEARIRESPQSRDTGSKARDNVRKAIKVVQDKLAKGDKHQRVLAEHIRLSVLPGYQYYYNQPQGDIWA